jgi:hypothetical protein
VNIETKGEGSSGVFTYQSSTLTLTGGTITTVGQYALGIHLNESTGTVNSVNIETKGNSSNGVNLQNSSTLTLTDSDISTTGNNSNAIYLGYYSTGTVSLNKNTLTGNITVEYSSTLALTGSNDTVITGNITSAANVFSENSASTINLTLTGKDTKLIGTLTHDATSTLNLTLGAGAAFIGSGTVSNLVLGDNAILGYTDNGPLVIDGTITVGDGILIDFGGVTVVDDDQFLILDWSNAELVGEVTVGQFTATNLNPDIEGTFTVAGNQLTFNATAIPEPSTCFLLGTGLGILLLTVHYRRRNVQS